MPPAMGQIDFDNPGQWGKLVRSSANGRVQLFELDFGQRTQGFDPRLLG
jgi:hypothetical protein